MSLNPVIPEVENVRKVPVPGWSFEQKVLKVSIITVRLRAEGVHHIQHF